jgi:hypothetical protein
MAQPAPAPMDSPMKSINADGTLRVDGRGHQSSGEVKFKVTIPPV